jgi:hypothetical protein
MEKKRVIRPSLLILLVIVGILGATRFIPLPPAGKFHIEGISGADACWQFKDGRMVLWEYPWAKAEKTNITQRVLGKYEKIGQNWVVFEERGLTTLRIETTLFELHLITTNGVLVKRAPRWWGL